MMAWTEHNRNPCLPGFLSVSEASGLIA